MHSTSPSVMAFCPMSRDFAIIHGKTPRGILPVNSYGKTPDGIFPEQLLNFYNIGLIIRILIYDLSQTLQNFIIKICIFFLSRRILQRYRKYHTSQPTSELRRHLLKCRSSRSRLLWHSDPLRHFSTAIHAHTSP